MTVISKTMVLLDDGRVKVSLNKQWLILIQGKQKQQMEEEEDEGRREKFSLFIPTPSSG